jgi:succinate dehydrogenase hydrophobic anchor subunit
MVQREIVSVTSRSQKVAVAPQAGTLLWILQRLTSYGLLVFLAVHVYFTYFARLDSTAAFSAADLKQPFNAFPGIYLINEALLLVCALFHGLNGLRNIIYDWTTNVGLRRAINVILTLVGLGFTAYGGWILWTLG